MKPTHQFRVDDAEKKLMKYLQEKNIKVGDLIPKEIELVDILGVSRTIVREALSRLRTQGLLETKRRRGTILTSPDFTSILKKSLHPTLLDHVSLKEFFELRLTLEVGMVDFIMQRKSKKDIQELRAIVNMEPEQTNSIIFNSVHEMRFHAKLYSMTRNESMIKFQEMLLPIFGYVHKSGILRRSIRSDKFVSHRQIVDVIEFGTADDLRVAMRQHLDTHFQRLFR